MGLTHRVAHYGACIFLLLAITPQAFASTISTSSAMESLTETPMHVTGFDAVVAEEHGFKIISHDGVQMSVPQNGSNSSPDNTVGGPCGTSYTYLTGGILEYQYYTGFTVTLPAVEYGWQINVVGPYVYDYNRTWAGALPSSRSWRVPASGDYEVPVDDSGYYDGAVNTATSYAILENGEICFSAGPTSRTYVNHP